MSQIFVEGYSSKNIRNENQDFIGAEKNKTNDHLVLLADGMGGHSEGLFCAKFVVNNLINEFKKSSNNDWENGEPFDWLREAIELVRVKLKKAATEKRLDLDMGTTLVGVVVSNNIAYCFNIGDSRCYIVINGNITRMTKDQIIKNYPELRHLGNPAHLVSALGPSKQGVIDFTYSTISKKAQIVLMSDGIHGVLSDSKINEIVNEKDFKLQDKTRVLVQKAITMGSTDNATCIIMEMN